MVLASSIAKIASFVLAGGSALAAFGASLVAVRMLPGKSRGRQPGSSRRSIELASRSLAMDVGAFVAEEPHSAERRARQRQADLKERYHEMALSQSQVSFWFSLAFASLGFLLLAATIVSVASSGELGASATATAVSSAVVETVSGLFFVQSNRAQRALGESFDKLRRDDSAGLALNATDQVDDQSVRDRLRAILALQLAGVESPPEAIAALVGESHAIHASEAARVAKD